MFAFAILIGVYSYLIFILGILHILYPWSVVLVTLFWIVGTVSWFKKDIVLIYKNNRKYLNGVSELSIFSKVCVGLLSLLWIVNLIGALAPEIAFDALWYHLTIPKIFIANHAYFFIDGGLYYYSVMPKLIDLLYVPAVMMGSDTVAKLIHYSLGLLTLLAIFQLAKRFLPIPVVLFVLVVFSSNLVVAWEATTAYIDLGRTFFEVMAVYGLVLYIQEKKPLWLTESAVMLGFAIASKMVALTSIPIFILILLYMYRTNITKGILLSLRYGLISLLVPLPYFIFSVLNTGNPVYPLFSKYLANVLENGTVSLGTIVFDYWQLFVSAADPINPLYIIVMPFLFLLFRTFKLEEKLFVIYILGSLFVWYVTPRTGGGRFILPYLPIFSIMVGVVVSKLRISNIRTIILGLGLLLAISTIGYRSIASVEEAKVVFGKESRSEYLTRELNYSFGDFYDTDNYLAQLLNHDDTVLVYGVHNLYYADFNFIHESYIQPGDEFNYILAPVSTQLPERFYAWKEIYTNPDTNVSLYSQGGTTWIY